MPCKLRIKITEGLSQCRRFQFGVEDAPPDCKLPGQSENILISPRNSGAMGFCETQPLPMVAKAIRRRDGAFEFRQRPPLSLPKLSPRSSDSESQDQIADFIISGTPQ